MTVMSLNSPKIFLYYIWLGYKEWFIKVNKIKHILIKSLILGSKLSSQRQDILMEIFFSYSKQGCWYFFPDIIFSIFVWVSKTSFYISNIFQDLHVTYNVHSKQEKNEQKFILLKI